MSTVSRDLAPSHQPPHPGPEMGDVKVGESWCGNTRPAALNTPPPLPRPAPRPPGPHVTCHGASCHVSRRLAAADCSMPVCGDGARDAGNGHGRYVVLCRVFVRGGNG